MLIPGQEKKYADSFYQMSRIPLWVYDGQEELVMTNVHSAILLHLMDMTLPLLRRYTVTCAVRRHGFLEASSEEMFVACSVSLNLRTQRTLLFGPVLRRTADPRKVDNYLSTKVVFQDQKLALLSLLPVMTKDEFIESVQTSLNRAGLDAPDLSDLRTKAMPREETSEEADTPSLIRIEDKICRCVSSGNAVTLSFFLNGTPAYQSIFASGSIYHKICRGIELLSSAKMAAYYAGCGGEQTDRIFEKARAELLSSNDAVKIAAVCGRGLLDYAHVVSLLHSFIPRSCSPVMKKSISVIMSHIGEGVTLDLIAEEVHLSAKYLSAMFVRETGMTFKDLLQKIRVQQACYMLRSGGLSFAEIADATGFCSQSHFNSVFKKYTGLTPREYRDLQNIDPWISTGDRLLNLLEG